MTLHVWKEADRPGGPGLGSEPQQKLLLLKDQERAAQPGRPTARFAQTQSAANPPTPWPGCGALPPPLPKVSDKAQEAPTFSSPPGGSVPARSPRSVSRGLGRLGCPSLPGNNEGPPSRAQSEGTAVAEKEDAKSPHPQMSWFQNTITPNKNQE